METKTNVKGKKQLLAIIPSWGLALLTMIGVIIVMFSMVFLYRVFGMDTKLHRGITLIVMYSIVAIGVAVTDICCFFIVRQNPKSYWYVPLIINAMFIISAFIDYLGPEGWVIVFVTLLLSIVASIIGAGFGNRNVIKNKSRK